MRVQIPAEFRCFGRSSKLSALSIVRRKTLVIPKNLAGKVDRSHESLIGIPTPWAPRAPARGLFEIVERTSRETIPQLEHGGPGAFDPLGFGFLTLRPSACRHPGLHGGRSLRSKLQGTASFRGCMPDTFSEFLGSCERISMAVQTKRTRAFMQAKAPGRIETETLRSPESPRCIDRSPQSLTGRRKWKTSNRKPVMRGQVPEASELVRPARAPRSAAKILPWTKPAAPMQILRT